MKFEEILLAARKKRNLSLRDASALIGISHTYLSALEKGFDPRSGKAPVPSQQVLLKICKAYELDYDKIFSTFSVSSDMDIYVNMGYQLRALRKDDPDRFKAILEIIYSD